MFPCQTRRPQVSGSALRVRGWQATEDLLESQTPRPQFVGKLRVNAITQRQTLMHISPKVYMLKKLAVWSVVAAMMVLTVLGAMGAESLAGYAPKREMGSSDGDEDFDALKLLHRNLWLIASAACNLLIMQFSGLVFGQLSERLNNWSVRSDLDQAPTTVVVTVVTETCGTIEQDRTVCAGKITDSRLSGSTASS